MNKKKGFTLVELIISIALLGILAVTFLPVFSHSIEGIFDSGKRNTSIQESQESVETVFAKDSVSGVSDSAEANTQLNITFSNPSNNFYVNGREITVTKVYNGKNTVLKGFLPD